jgi:hypothetical protein
MSSRPLSAQELCQSVRACAPFDASRLDRVLAVDETRGLVEVQSGATWKSLAARLRPGDNRAREVRTTHPTIGESLALPSSTCTRSPWSRRTASCAVSIV